MMTNASSVHQPYLQPSNVHVYYCCLVVIGFKANRIILNLNKTDYFRFTPKTNIISEIFLLDVLTIYQAPNFWNFHLLKIYWIMSETFDRLLWFKNLVRQLWIQKVLFLCSVLFASKMRCLIWWCIDFTFRDFRV